MKTPDQLHAILTSLIGGWEGECVEFKEGGDNEANLRARSSAWLVFGVKNSTQRIVGTTYRPDTGRLHGLKQQIANGCEPSTTFREIHELLTDDGRVIRFIDENYSRALLVHADMAWPEVLALDTIQKGSLPDEESLLNLRKQGLVEGRKPNLHVTAEIAAATDIIAVRENMGGIYQGEWNEEGEPGNRIASHRFDYRETDVRRIMAHPRSMIGSDGIPHDAVPHPRLWGTFPRVLGHYVREVGLFSLETAIHKMTGRTAAVMHALAAGWLEELHDEALPGAH